MNARLLAAGTGIVGLMLTLGIAISRSYPGVGEDRYKIGVVTVDDLQDGQLGTAAAVVLVFTAAVHVGRPRRERTRRQLLIVTALFVLAMTTCSRHC